MDLSAGLSAASNAISIAKSLKDIEKNYDLAVLKAKIAEIYESLSDTKMSLVDAKENIAGLEAEIKRLRQAAQERLTLRVGDGGYKYSVNASGGLEGFPACPKCEQSDSRLVNLVQNGDVKATKCPVCALEFKPVTCYLVGGSTLHEQHLANQRQKSAEMQRKMDRAYGDRSWMG